VSASEVSTVTFRNALILELQSSATKTTLAPISPPRNFLMRLRASAIGYGAARHGTRGSESTQKERGGKSR